MNQLFKLFYSNYNYIKIKKAYNLSQQNTLFSNIYKNIPFNVEIKMKNDILAMQLSTDAIISMELMTLIGYFFENYSEEKNCVWTKNEGRIINFFTKGIGNFIDFSGKIHFNLSKNDVNKLIGILVDKNKESDKKIYKELCDNFKLLETMNWNEYKAKIQKEYEDCELKKHIEQVTSMDLPLDWSNAFAFDEKTRGVHAERISDGLLLSLNNLGKVDIEYISQITGEDYKTVISELRGSIYQNPEKWDECFYKGWETSDEYLSGNVAEKWEKARKANKIYNGYFENNVKALDKIIPKGVLSKDIFITLGSPWVPVSIIENFIEHIFGKLHYLRCLDGEKVAVKHDEDTGIWEIQAKSFYKGNVKSHTTYGTKRLEAIYILERTLNMKTISVTDEVSCSTNKSGKKRVINQVETLLALEKQKKLINEFQTWVWSDQIRSRTLTEIYNEKFCSNVVRHYDGSFLTFPDMSPTEDLFDYQKNAVARIILSPNTLLAHEVGAGKTYVMTAAGMEMKRIGISNKNLYVVPNNLVGQWRSIFLKLYPNANLLCVEPRNFSKNKREKMLEKIRDNDYDGIIMAYSCFELIPISKEYYKEELKKRIAVLDQIAYQNTKATTGSKRKKEKLQEALFELEQAIIDSYNGIYFDELEINTLFVDEAHNFKNVPIETKTKNVLGISANGSAKCQDMMDKARIVQKNNNGRGVVFATGTPVTNSLTDIFVMQKYLQDGQLTLLDLQNFDSWLGMFAEKDSDIEVDVDTSNYRIATRFSKYHNMPELSSLIATVTDFFQVDKTNGIPETDGYKDIIIGKTQDFQNYLQNISRRAEDVRDGLVSRKEDNMLKITTDGRKAALDLRLVDSMASFTHQSKVAHCAENIFDIYMNTHSKKSTQLVFCDTSTPKTNFNLYDELKNILVNMGIDADKIAYIHDATSEKTRNELFMKVRNGEIRVLIGSTFKLGLGVNVQNKLIALHHLDVPWRPADMIQREGRILRRGNENKKIEIYRYITDGSFDAYSWQLLETKQKMISAILKGSMPERMCDEVSDAVLNYAEVKAIAIGNPLLKKRFETSNELRKNLTLQRAFIETRENLEIELINLPYKISNQEQLVENCKADILNYSRCKREYKKDERKIIRQLIHDELSKNILSTTEKLICNYQGFDIILPVNMIQNKPYIYIQGRGKYHLEMGLAESGILVRIDNFFEELGTHLENLSLRLKEMKQREIDIKIELKKENKYSGIIENLKAELAHIDKKLGVEKQ